MNKSDKFLIWQIVLVSLSIIGQAILVILKFSGVEIPQGTKNIIISMLYILLGVGILMGGFVCHYANKEYQTLIKKGEEEDSK